jgi:hypothetical protein
MNAQQPDTLWDYDAQGNRTVGRPNYAKPGVFERVQREALEAEWIARGGTGGSLFNLIVMNRDFERLEGQTQK